MEISYKAKVKSKSLKEFMKNDRRDKERKD